MQPANTFTNGQSAPPSTGGLSPNEDSSSLWSSFVDDDDYDGSDFEWDTSPDDNTDADDWDDGLAGTLEVRNFDGGNWYRVHNNLLLGGWGAAIGPYGIAVYNALAMRVKNSTQQNRTSRRTIKKLCGVSPNKITEIVRELEAWGLIHCEHRFGEDGQETNRFTLLGERHWRQEATFRNAKGVLVTKRLSDAKPESGRRAGDEMQVSNLQGRPPGASDGRGGLPDGSGRTPHDPEIVRPATPGGTPGGHIQDCKTESQDVSKTTGEKREQPSGGRTLPPLRSGNSGNQKVSDRTVKATSGTITSDRRLTELEQIILSVSSSRRLTAPMQQSLREPVTCVHGKELPKEYQSPHNMYEQDPALFNEYVHLCARRYREEVGKRPPAKDLIRNIRVYCRYQTGWLDFRKAAQKEERTNPPPEKRPWYYDPSKPAWMQ